MRFTVLVLFICVVTFGYSQTQERTKKVEVYKSVDLNFINAIYEIDNNNRLTILWLGQDSGYQHIDNYITLFSGYPKEFKDFLEELNIFYKENEVGVSGKVNGVAVSLSKLMGKKMITIYESNGIGSKVVSLKRIEKIKDKFLKWCEKNNVEY